MAFSDVDDHGLVLAESELEVFYKDQSRKIRSNVTFRLGRNPQIIIKTLDPVEMQDGLMGPQNAYRVRIQPEGDPSNVLAIQTPHIFGGNDAGIYWHFTPELSPLFIDGAEQLSTVHFGLVNFGSFRLQMPGESIIRQNCLTLTADNWKLEIRPSAVEVLGEYSKAENWSYHITHSAVLTRVDGGAFSSESAHDILDTISSFFTFCRGRWIAPALVRGFDEAGTLVMQEWGTRTIEPISEEETWLESMNGQVMAEVFPGFLRRHKDPEWKDAIAIAVYWYSRANSLTAAGADGSIILAQGALERLAWEILVRKTSAVSKDSFNGLKAAGQVRLLLYTLSIPIDMPSDLEDLQKPAKEFNWQDGPQAFVEVRNAIVHPEKVAKKTEQGFTIYEAWVLGQWYLELVLLRIFDFDGVYQNRLKKRRYTGSVERVPWAGQALRTIP